MFSSYTVLAEFSDIQLTSHSTNQPRCDQLHSSVFALQGAAPWRWQVIWRFPKMKIVWIYMIYQLDSPNHLKYFVLVIFGPFWGFGGFRKWGYPQIIQFIGPWPRVPELPRQISPALSVNKTSSNRERPDPRPRFGAIERGDDILRFPKIGVPLVIIQLKF